MYETIALLFLASVLWGSTNPILKRGGSGIENIHSANKIQEIIAKIKFVFFNWKCVAPLLINQCGSLVYYLALSTADISIAVPVTNSLTLIITTIAGSFLGEKISLGQLMGSILVIAGVCLTILGKQ